MYSITQKLVKFGKEREREPWFLKCEKEAPLEWEKNKKEKKSYKPMSIMFAMWFEPRARVH